jgi:hypothetical protein
MLNQQSQNPQTDAWEGQYNIIQYQSRRRDASRVGVGDAGPAEPSGVELQVGFGAAGPACRGRRASWLPPPFEP